MKIVKNENKFKKRNSSSFPVKLNKKIHRRCSNTWIWFFFIVVSQLSFYFLFFWHQHSYPRRRTQHKLIPSIFIYVRCRYKYILNFLNSTHDLRPAQRKQNLFTSFISRRRSTPESTSQNSCMISIIVQIYWMIAFVCSIHTDAYTQTPAAHAYGDEFKRACSIAFVWMWVIFLHSFAQQRRSERDTWTKREGKMIPNHKSKMADDVVWGNTNELCVFACMFQHHSAVHGAAAVVRLWTARASTRTEPCIQVKHKIQWDEYVWCCYIPPIPLPLSLPLTHGTGHYSTTHHNIYKPHKRIETYADRDIHLLRLQFLYLLLSSARIPNSNLWFKQSSIKNFHRSERN